MPAVSGVSKPAGMRCAQLTADNRCALFDDPRRPAVCASLRASPQMCGTSREHAMRWLTRLEAATIGLTARPPEVTSP
jgi:hypothetical protein